MQALGPDAAKAAVSRSFLFVPGDSGRKLAKAADSAADALIVDLEDSVAASGKAKARSVAREFLSGHAGRQVWVRINPLDTEDALSDLREVMPASPAGIVLPKPHGAEDAVRLAKLLDAFEQECGLQEGRTRILPIATERPQALFTLHEYAGATARLAGLTWGAEDLSTAAGARACRDAAGKWLAPYEMVRALCLVAAAAAGVPAIDTVFTDYRNEEGLREYAAGSRRDGFRGMLAIHPAQVGIINEAFLPSAAEVAYARRVVELFAANPDAGTIGMDGTMLDRPHLLQAQGILELAGRHSQNA